jgi:ech hydrogenase subunit A
VYIFTALVLLPVIVGALLWLLSFRILTSFMFFFSFILATLSTILFFYPLMDVGLIMYFLKEGLSFKSKKVWILAIIQLLLFIIAESLISGGEKGIDFIVDDLSIFMFTVINIVGSLIVAFSVWYIKKEDISDGRRRVFLFYLTLFLSIMNLIVVANSLMIFFLLFEMTTLASYLLIGF